MPVRSTRCYDRHRMADPSENLQASYEAQIRSLGEQLARQERALTVLAEVASEVHSTENADSVFAIALDRIRDRLGAGAAWIFTGEEGETTLKLAAARGVSRAFLQDAGEGNLPECLCVEALWSGHTMQARTTAQCPRMPDIVASAVASTGHACIPLRFRGKSRGLLNVVAPDGTPFNDADLRFLETLGHQIGLAVERARRGESERQKHEEARNAYRELRAAQERIIESEKMALLGTFAAGLAHEIRNPLNSIALQLSVLERRNNRLQADLGISELIDIVREEVSRLDALAGDFLQFSRADRVQQGEADLGSVIEHALRLLDPESVAGNVRLTYAPMPGLAPLKIDAEKMKQVLINLLRNAIEAMPEGGEVSVRVEGRDDWVLLSVEDTGPGIPDDLDLFQLFVTTKPKGTGLGLSIARQIIVQHGGVISASNLPEKGARIEVALPRAPSEAAR